MSDRFPNPWQESIDPLDPLNEGYRIPPPPQLNAAAPNGAMPSSPIPPQPQMMPPMPGMSTAPPVLSSPRHVQADRLQQQIEDAKRTNPWGAHPSWWRTALAAAAQFGTRKNPALGQTIAGAITGSDPKVRLAQQTIHDLQLQKEAADEERAQSQLDQTSQYHNILGQIRQGNAAALDQSKKLAERDRLSKEGAEPLPTIPAAPLPQGLPPSVSSVLSAAPTPPPQPVRFANAMAATDPINNQPLQIPSKVDQEIAQKRAAQEVQQAGWKVLPDDIAENRGYPKGTTLPPSEWTRVIEGSNKPDAAQTSAAAKQAFTGTMSKLASARVMDQGALTDPRKQWMALDAGVKSGIITQDEASAAKGYMTANPTPAQQDLAGIMRMAVLAQTRGGQYLDTRNGNAPVTLNWEQINESNRDQPGRFIPAGVGTPALTRTALMEDIRGNVQQVRGSLQNMPDFDTMDKAKIALALRSRDPRGTINQLVSSGAIGSLTGPQQDYLINLTNLVENAMAMRSVLGAGQGSEDLRSAITATIPGPTTPTRDYALKQLDVFEKVINRLERGVPKVPLRTDTGNTGSGATPQTQAGPKQGDIETHAGFTYQFDGTKWVKQKPVQ